MLRERGIGSIVRHALQRFVSGQLLLWEPPTSSIRRVAAGVEASDSGVESEEGVDAFDGEVGAEG
jgi:hypothetical protein